MEHHLQPQEWWRTCRPFVWKTSFWIIAAIYLTSSMFKKGETQPPTNMNLLLCLPFLGQKQLQSPFNFRCPKTMDLHVGVGHPTPDQVNPIPGGKKKTKPVTNFRFCLLSWNCFVSCPDLDLRCVFFSFLEKNKSIPTTPSMAALSARHVLRLLRPPYALQARQGRLSKWQMMNLSNEWWRFVLLEMDLDVVGTWVAKSLWWKSVVVSLVICFFHLWFSLFFKQEDGTIKYHQNP